MVEPCLRLISIRLYLGLLHVLLLYPHNLFSDQTPSEDSLDSVYTLTRPIVSRGHTSLDRDRPIPLNRGGGAARVPFIADAPAYHRLRSREELNISQMWKTFLKFDLYKYCAKGSILENSRSYIPF